MSKSTEAIKALLGHLKFADTQLRKQLVDLTDNSGRSALHLASFNECEEMTAVCSRVVEM